MLALLLAATIAAPTQPQSVIGGEPSTDPRFDATVEIENVAAGKDCSGVLVRPDLVLTAGHCLVGEPQPEQIIVRTPVGAVAASAFGVHPDMCLTCGLDEYDVGFVRLSSALDVPPLDLVLDQDTWDATVYEGATVTVVGYGFVPDLEGRTGARWQVEVPIRHFTRSGLEFVAGGDGKDSCRGDSGGPALVQTDDGQWRVAAVTARGPTDCGPGGFYTVLYPVLGWLSDASGEPLCGPSCGDCSCVDTRPPDEGCCSTDRPRDVPWLLFVGLGVLGLRRRGH